MSGKLFTLFDDRLKSQRDLAAGPSQNLDDISVIEAEQQSALRKIKRLEEVVPKVDYSDFSNFVFFNSALDYFNITGEKILNDYPYNGTRGDYDAFIDGLDDYQKYVVGVWPSRIGHLRFNPAHGFAYVSVNDVGRVGNVSTVGALNPGTGSFAVELWSIPPPALTGSEDAMVVFQKVSGSAGYSVFFSGSSIFFNVMSGALSTTLSASATPGSPAYFAFSFDAPGGSMILLSGSATSFPVVARSGSHGITTTLNIPGTPVTMASGSLSGKKVRPLTGSLDEVRLWNVPLTVADVTSSFNARVWARDDLISSWRFNESGSTADPAQNAIVLDYAGARANGTIVSYYDSIRGSGSLVPFDSPDPILDITAPEVVVFVQEQQVSGSAYDRDNDNIITNLFPSELFRLEDERKTTVLRDFIYAAARQYDYIKVRIDQFSNVLSLNYGQFDQTPDALLEEVGRFYGWEFTGNFLSTDVTQYIVGKNVLSNLEANREIDSKLYQIKSEFWKRTLLNLSHIYKTKGTRESVEALFRIYGVDQSFVRLKEYGSKQNAGVVTHRIGAEKSLPTLVFGSGSSVITARLVSPNFSSSLETVEFRAAFPTSETAELVSTISTGSIWTITTGSVAPKTVYQLYFTRDTSSVTGSLHLTGSEGLLSLSDVPIFDGHWYNISFVRSSPSSSLSLQVRLLDTDEITTRYSASLSSAPAYSGTNVYNVVVGASGSYSTEMWGQEFRVWSEELQPSELDDHTLNFQSYGTDEIESSTLDLHYRLRETDVVIAVNGDPGYATSAINSVFDYSKNKASGSLYGFVLGSDPYETFLFDYNYIASPEYGWNEDKVRILGGSIVDPRERFADSNLVALEINMVDALNEDISQIISSLDGFNNIIGLPANRYRDDYPDIEKLRKNYFSRLQGALNFKVFADMMDFFDRSFIDLTRRLMPARVNFIGDEFIVESHMLERPKHRWNYRRQEVPFQPLGVITVYVRT